MTQDDPNKLITTRETAERIGMSESFLRQARMNANRDSPKYVKIGRAVRYRISDIEEWLARNTQS